MVKRPQSQCWLMKCEPGAYSIDDLARDRHTAWEGVRNYQARNFLRDDMRVGDEVLFYHSNAEPSGVAGLARVCTAGYPDHFAFDPAHKYFDPDSDPTNPRWYMVDLAFVAKFPRVVALADLKSDLSLAGMMVLQRGSRLSVQPVTRLHFERVKAVGTAH